MKTIKFRAWDIEEKIMYSTAFPTWNGQCQVWKNNKPQTIILELSMSEPEDDVVVMQYTGLRDKNGVEVYEGDIVRNKLISWTREVEVAQIIFEDGGYVLVGNHGYHVGLREKYSKEIEVIGNIYQNPELLTHPTT